MNLNNLPSDPGCYLFKDKNNIIYIGKAKNLKKRVKSYFNKRGHDEKTQRLIKEIKDVEFFATTNEVEALILENNLIKKHKPKYNINLTDSRRFAHIIRTDEDYPRLLVGRDKKIKGKYYGPFTSAEYRDQVLKLLRQSFQIRTCNKLPKKACLRYHIKLCSAPCIKEISKQDYNNDVKNAEFFLKGNVRKLMKKLEKEMKHYAKKLIYEKSRIIRDQIYALDSLREKQKVETEKRYDEDIINYIIDSNTVYLIVFNISRGVLATKSEFSFDYTKNFLEEFITQYYAQSNIPKEIILPQKLKDDSIKDYLEKIRKAKVKLNIPQKGDKLSLLSLVKRNIEISFLRENQMINSLRQELNLNSNPNIIECFDISNIRGKNLVGAMVQYKNAKPQKSEYRRFRIKTVYQIDDCASMKEIVYRRYYRIKKELKEMPDLIVIDGGKGQLFAAQKALAELEVKAPIISLAKRNEEIYEPGKTEPIKLKKDSKALKLLTKIRDEAHRFAIKYHKLLRSEEMIRE
ncbi:excinuclease ABC subunit C [Candidatus Woesearchaeota archaeon]|nr:excinuclease ABC subunit C [Candidatus Woesearchaeota archaeon]